MRSALGLRSVAGQVCALMLVIVTLLVLATGTTLVLQARSGHETQARGRALAIADTFAAAPGVRRALESRDPSATLQPYATRLRRESGVGYIVVTSPRGLRYAHPDPKLIGTRAALPLHPATAGRSFTDEIPAAALPGPSIRAAVPVAGDRGRVVGIVNVGVALPEVSASVSRQLPVLYGSTALALVLGAAGAALVGRRLRRLTHRLDPAELTRMYEHHDAVLRAVREGVLILDGQGRLVLANDEARRLLGLPPEVRGGRLTEAGLAPETAGLLASGRAVTDEVIQVGDRLLAVNQRPASRRGQLWGSVATLRDTTELQALTDKADAAWVRLELLYDASVRVGTSLDMTRTAEELGDVAVPRFADFATVDLLESVLRGEEPVDARSRMRRVAVSAVREERPQPPSGHTLLAVPLSARGVLLGQVEFRRLEGAAPFDDEDRSFADELVGQAAVAIDNARRYAREHATALALQQSLLPRGRPEQRAVEAAYRYLPAHAGVGGDWFDIIPLSGARVALVVGDVVGHGLHAAATMGRLRTAVHNFSVVDLPPDELLTQLDDVVAQLDQEEAARNGGIGAVGASCLYAVYDPVAQRCTLARAGHPPPAVVDPGGTVTIPDLPAGPPLGLGGRLFEVSAIPLPAGSRLVLYTNGLVQDRERDIDTGLDLLRRALAPADPDPGRTCDAVMGALLPPRPTDDVVLLVARTTALDERHVASWDLPPDPAVVAGMRAAVARTLADWNLDEAVFTTELVVSELLGNAIRHADGPIRLRLLRNRTLICEVADGSSTSPHLRRAAITDEGGRGLFLVAQMVQRWGTRYTSEGKIIWAEQDLPHDLPEDVPSGLN
ncbi:SpoIIE family protein phosphatase [Streptomyces botrytidirepellens]|uniref:protein-serine/threonine phosphatase n=1 Tax=Streptomyces botrytidirepellens TaxID=2486417 RepID=A0A3M8SAR3_9ACTN|nr:SpoIIE family protein phosphatase [Streptomyces botrytidirepellens]RNF78241.1 PAS domain-containing protein [Streptomyces botrytidirepellens]